MVLLPCASVQVSGNLTPKKYREKIYKTRIFCSMSAHSFHPDSFPEKLAFSEQRSEIWGEPCVLRPLCKPEENLHGAFQRQDKHGQFVVNLISRLAPIFKTSSSLPVTSKGAMGLKQSVFNCSYLCCLQTHMYTRKC